MEAQVAIGRLVQRFATIERAGPFVRGGRAGFAGSCSIRLGWVDRSEVFGISPLRHHADGGERPTDAAVQVDAASTRRRRVSVCCSARRPEGVDAGHRKLIAQMCASILNAAVSFGYTCLYAQFRRESGRPGGPAGGATLEDAMQTGNAGMRKHQDGVVNPIRLHAIRRRVLVRAAGAIVILAAGFALGASSDPLAQSAAYRLIAPGWAGPSLDAEAAHAAYQKGHHARALRLAQPLAEQGDARSQSLVGLIHYTGRGVVRDDAKAAKWLRLAADQGDAAARFRLGLMYSEGHGVPQDHAEAAKWYRLAADQRHPQAQYNLGLLYAAGEGVEQDYRMAHMWFNLAVVHFPRSATGLRNAAINSRDVMAGKLTREAVAEAQKLAREWQPTARGEHGKGTS
jgi:TPR repeat protein